MITQTCPTASAGRRLPPSYESIRERLQLNPPAAQSDRRPAVDMEFDRFAGFVVKDNDQCNILILIPYFFSNSSTILRRSGVRRELFAIWTYGAIEIYFQYYKDKPPFDQPEKRMELLSKLNSIPGISIPESKIEKRPSISIDVLQKEDNLKSFLQVYDWFLEEIE